MHQGVSVPSRGSIVIVEPDDLIRELLERWLDEAGYRAVPVAGNHGLPMVMPRLVITDISEPGGAGNTIEALQATYAAPILALSARFRRGLGPSSEPAERLHVAKVLPKPFTRDQLLRAVRETLKDV
jgi:DNA-binding response OmpR family regulator